MTSLWTSIVMAWVLMCLTVVGICAPAAALGQRADRSAARLEFGPALVWTWLTIALGVPATAAFRGFNWVTALVVCAGWPTALWLVRHRRGYRVRFRDTVRALVLRAIALREANALELNSQSLVPIIAMLLLPLPSLMMGGTDLRLPAPTDFDTLWHTRQLLAGNAVWDPLASLAAVLIRLSAADALHVSAALRLALIALAAAAAGVLIAELGCRRAAAGAAAAAIVVLAPPAPMITWSVVLVGLIGVTSLLRRARDRSARDGWHAMAALVLAVGQLVPFLDRPGELLAAGTSPRYLEHRAVADQAVRLSQSLDDLDSVIVGPPELRLEIGGEERTYDLAEFVSRFRDRTNDRQFRFDFPARRVFVFVEKRPFVADDPPRRVRFVSAQPAVYRVPRERSRLARLARQICDDYRRTHAGVAIMYEDAMLRVYRIDL
jgi:hypothetical protein